MEKAYATYTAVLDKIEENAEGVAETINGLADLLAKAKNFAKNYKGGKTEAAKAKAYEENIKKAQALLLKNPNLPDSLKTVLTASQAAAQVAWDFYKTGSPCSVSSSGGGGNSYFYLPLVDCAAFAEAVNSEAVAIEKANLSLTCNCAEVATDCDEISQIMGAIKSANASQNKSYEIHKNNPYKNYENDGESYLTGIDIGKNCFHIKIENLFSTGTKLLDLSKFELNKETNTIKIKDFQDEVAVNITLSPKSRGTFSDLVVYLGFKAGNLEEYRIRAFMRMLRDGEGTLGEIGYETLFGGESFIKDYNKDWSDHPKLKIKRGKIRSSASGAYQVMGYTWDETDMVEKRNTYEIKDFSPESQDLFCVVLLKHKRPNGWENLLKGRIEDALNVYSYEWASLPPPRYGQPANDLKTCIELFEKNLKEEQNGNSPLHLKSGFLEKFK